MDIWKNLDKFYFANGMKGIEKRCAKCFEYKGYVE